MTLIKIWKFTNMSIFYCFGSIFFLASNVSVSTSNLATQKLIVHMNVHTMENIGVNFQNVLCISLGCTYILIIFLRFFSHLNSLYTHKSFVVKWKKKKSEVKVIQKVAWNQLKIGYELATRLVIIATRGFLPYQNSYGYRVILSLKFFYVKIDKNQPSRQTCYPNWLIFGYVLLH